MPIPALNEHGHLPEGIHDATLAEIESRFGSFQRSDRRCQLFRRLKAFIGQAQSTGFFAAIVVDGSFVTGKDEPNDIDLILVFRAEHDFNAGTRPFEYNVISKKQIRRLFRFDVLLATENRNDLHQAIAFFSRVRDHNELRKGLLRIQL